jgi:hypothetical protein
MVIVLSLMVPLVTVLAAMATRVGATRAQVIILMVPVVTVLVAMAILAGTTNRAEVN